MSKRIYYVYILASQKYGTLYIGVTSNLPKRIFEHKYHLIKGFTQKYDIERLVYFEEYEDINIAITREKQLKKWKRDWKIRLIENKNPDWTDLSISLNLIPNDGSLPSHKNSDEFSG